MELGITLVYEIGNGEFSSRTYVWPVFNNFNIILNKFTNKLSKF